MQLLYIQAKMGNVIEGLSDHVTAKTTETSSTQDGAIQFAVSEMKGWRDTMEDCHTTCTSIPIHGSKESLDDHCLFAVYDGHGGGFTSSYAGSTFVRVFSKRPELKQYAALPKVGKNSREDVTGVDKLRRALRATFLDLDRDLWDLQIAQNESMLRKLTLEREANHGRETNETLHAQSRIRPERSGSTIVVVLITPSHTICANAGDSRAILRQGSKVFPLSFDHKPSNVCEQERIIAAGGFVRGRRVDGDLAVSRGLGDFGFKNEQSLPPHKQRVIAEPDFMVYPRDDTKDEFVVLACDGVFDVVTNGQCSELVQEILDEGETDLGLICEEVMDTCLEKNSRDNMTMIMVALPGIKMCRDLANSRNAVWARRAARQARMLEFQARITAQNAGAGFGLDFGLIEPSQLPPPTIKPPKRAKMQRAVPVFTSA